MILGHVRNMTGLYSERIIKEDSTVTANSERVSALLHTCIAPGYEQRSG